MDIVFDEKTGIGGGEESPCKGWHEHFFDLIPITSEDRQRLEQFSAFGAVPGSYLSVRRPKESPGSLRISVTEGLATIPVKEA